MEEYVLEVWTLCRDIHDQIAFKEWLRHYFLRVKKKISQLERLS